MNLQHPTLAVRKGDSLAAVQKLLELTTPPELLPDFDEPVYFYYLPELGFWVFFNESRQVYSIRFDHPYPYAVEGVHIGDDEESVLSIRGKPERRFPVVDRKARWLYDQPQFLRIDFDPRTGRVEKIFR